MAPLKYYKKIKFALRQPPNPPTTQPFSFKFSDTPHNERSHYLSRILCTDAFQLQIEQLLVGRSDLMILCEGLSTRHLPSGENFLPSLAYFDTPGADRSQLEVRLRQNRAIFEGGC